MTALISAAILAVALYLLSLITKAFFIPSLATILAGWRWPPPAAAGFLTVARSSAPVLGIAMLAVFKDGGAHSDVGIGTVVGSAVFHMLVISGASAILREFRTPLPAFLRDTLVYLTGILLLLFVFYDGGITRMESASFIGCYGAYLLLILMVPLDSGDAETGDPVQKRPEGAPLSSDYGRKLVPHIERLTGDPGPHPLRALAVSLLFILVLSRMIVDMAVLFAGSVGLPPVVVALTLLAGGTSAPDLVCSMSIAARGRVGMAAAHAVEAAILNLLVGLGLPWLVSLTLLGRPFVGVATNDLLVSVFVLAAAAIAVFLFLYTDRQLTRRKGWALLAAYTAYAAWTISAG